MGRYCTVGLDINNFLIQPNEFIKLQKKAYDDGYSYYSNPLRLTRVVDTGKIQSSYVSGFLGFPKKVEERIYDDLPVICEICGEYFQDVITGNKYYYRCNRQNDDAYQILFFKISDLSGDNLAEILKKLTPEDVSRYKHGIQMLEKFVTDNQKAFMELERQRKIISENNEQYIKKFRDTYNQK